MSTPERTFCCFEMKRAVWDRSDPSNPRVIGWECRFCSRWPVPPAYLERERLLKLLRARLPAYKANAENAAKPEVREACAELAHEAEEKIKQLEGEDWEEVFRNG